LQADHPIEPAVRKQLHGGSRVLRSQKPVVRRGRATSLQMTENGIAGLDLGRVLDLFGQYGGDPAKTDLFELSRQKISDDHGSAHGLRSFGNDDDAESLA